MADINDQRAPRFALPSGTTDCHFHVYAKGARFPAHEMEQALALHRRLGIERGVIVQADPDSRTVTLAGLAIAGANYRAITPILAVPTDAELDFLHQAGMRGARFTFTARHGGPPDIAMMRQTIERIAPLGWHVDFLMGPEDLLQVFDFLRSITVPFVFDHMARIDVAQGLDQPGFQALLELVKRDHAWVKLSGCDRLSTSGAPYHEALPFAHALIAVAPDRVIWGTDWPHPNNAHNPDDADLVDLVPLIAPDEKARHQMLIDNPARLFGFAR
jgi:2-pyrone-4,6-dicarboxylate lactonase